MSFRRNIMATEWEHQKMRMQINDYVEQIKDVDGVKVAKITELFNQTISLLLINKIKPVWLGFINQVTNNTL